MRAPALAGSPVSEHMNLWGALQEVRRARDTMTGISSPAKGSCILDHSCCPILHCHMLAELQSDLKTYSLSCRRESWVCRARGGYDDMRRGSHEDRGGYHDRGSPYGESKDRHGGYQDRSDYGSRGGYGSRGNFPDRPGPPDIGLLDRRNNNSGIYPLLPQTLQTRQAISL